MPDVDAATLLKNRQTALLERWAAGKRLASGELEEIADLLPKAPAPLRLEAQVEGQPVSGYQKEQVDYAATYGTAVRSVKFWVGKGRRSTPVDLPPLDEPGLMPAWWARHMKHRVPTKILEAAQTAQHTPLASVNAPALIIAPGVMLSPLEQARTLNQLAFTELQAAITAVDPARLTIAQRAYVEASEQLRKVELADPKIRSAAGVVIDREKVRVVLTTLHTSIAQAARTFIRRLRRELSGKTAAEQDAIWEAGMDKLFASFRECEFADPV